MRKMLLTGVLFLATLAGFGTALAQSEEPLVYVIKSGDTLWGLSDRFLKDPHYWPGLWARNDPTITNPHFIYPGQKVKVFADRIVVEPLPEPVAVPDKAPAIVAAPEETPLPKTFTMRNGAGFLLENANKPAGRIVATHQNRNIVGEDDIVYTDIGRTRGGKVGDRYSIYKNLGPISHPVTNFIMGSKIIPLGTLQISELEEQSSRAIVTKSFIEIGAGSYLMPYRERKKEVTLKASNLDLAGYIIAAQTGSQAMSAGDVAFIDLGSSQGLEVGNMLYVVRDVVPDQKYVDGTIDKFPVELLGALVVVEMGEKTATAVIVKSIDTIYPGDRLELRKNK